MNNIFSTVRAQIRCKIYTCEDMIQIQVSEQVVESIERDVWGLVERKVDDNLDMYRAAICYGVVSQIF